MRWWMVTIAPSSVFSPFGRKATFSTGGEKAFGMQQPMKQCAAGALASLGGSCQRELR